MESVHQTVLLNETIEGLNLPKRDSIVVDGTFGGGGHSLEILKRYPQAKIIAIDQDKSAFEKAKSKFKGLEDRIFFINTNFRNLSNEEKVDGVVLDLGLSSDQLENSGRGFSFKKDEPLLMTMKENPLPEDLTARDVVNGWSEENLADIIYGYGEERFSRRIAKGIVDTRQKEKIMTTFDLLRVIEKAVPASYRKEKINCATKTFQAIRIAVNDELNALKDGLEKSFEILKSKGRMSVISFHSLEDRIIKNFYKDKQKRCEAILINKKPVIASGTEIKNNPRSRSAKLRILEKI
jgi:16S rRNA (cytosine1402-N4)-methyltransferase